MLRSASKPTAPPRSTTSAATVFTRSWPSRCPAWAASPATWPGAATGSISSRPIASCCADVGELSDITLRIRKALEDEGITGAGGAWIDHIELAGPPSDSAQADIKNFVLCPGGEYDRSPCGTGTCAKLACLAADGKLRPGEPWRQESIVGSIFTGRYRPADHPDGGIIPTVTGHAWVNGDLKLVIDPHDPFKYGIDPQPAKC